MKPIQKLNIQFRLNEQKEKDGKHPIYIRIYVDGKKSEIATQFWLQKKHWNPKENAPYGSCPDKTIIEAYLASVKSDIQRDFLTAQSLGNSISVQELKARVTGTDITPKQKTILEAFDYHNLKMKQLTERGMVVPKTLQRYEITRNKVEKFMSIQYRKEDMPLQEMRLAFVTEFEHYLLVKDKLQSNTAYKYIKNLKKIMTMAVSLDWIPSNPFNAFRCSYQQPKREVLSLEELETIRTKKLSVPRIAEVRDVFIFCCYTGFAYSDVYKLRPEDLTKGIDGETWIIIERQKTGTRESVPLLPIALEIVNRYRSHPYCMEYGKLLPVNSNQRYNSYLKELADICGIQKHLTTHIARHTFATTVTLSNGVPIETVSKMLGHTKLATTQIYAQVVDTKLSQDMQKLKAKLHPTLHEASNKAV